MFSFGAPKPASTPMSPRVAESKQYLKKHPEVQVKLDAALNACLAAQGRAWPVEINPVEYIQHALRALPYLGSNVELLGAEEIRAASVLVSIGQGHLFANWPSAGKDDDKKLAFFAQVLQLNASYPGGLKAYHSNSVRLLAAAKEGANPFEGWQPEVPAGERVAAGSDKFFALEKAGMDVVGQTGFVLVAGGLGERLGYNGIKIALPVDSITGKSFMQWYAEYILAFQAHACRGAKKIPLAIMTSDDTHSKTVAFLKDNGYFGLTREQVTLVKQEKVPSLTDNTAKFSKVQGNPYELETKPHGHGDVHSLLWSEGVATSWMRSGIKYVVFFQDTNALTFRALPAMLGVSVKSRFEYNSLTVPRTAGEAVGGIARLRHEDGRSMTVNVEYNQLDPLLRATNNAKGDVPDESGFSPYPGNINVLVIDMCPYYKVLEKTRGLMPEFVNPKYKDESRTTFTKPTRLECMMQDYPKLLDASARVGFTQIDRWLCFSPVKNNAADAAKKQAAGTPPESASTGEADMYAACARMLRVAGMEVEEGEPTEHLGITVSLAPQIHLAPAFAATWAELNKKVKGGKLTKRSSLVVNGDVTMLKVTLDGALVLRPAPGTALRVDGLTETNNGWEMKPLAPADLEKEPEEIRMRGYKLVKHWSRTFASSGGKEVVVRQ